MSTPRASHMIRSLETAWRGIQERHPDVPDCVLITADPGARKCYGWFAAERWTPKAAPAAPTGAALDASATPATPPAAIHEVLIAGNRLRTAEGVLETLIHEAGHALNRARCVVDTDKTGRRHNRKFAAAAEELGLSCAQAGCHGWAHTELLPATIAEYSDTLGALSAALAAYRHEEHPGKGKTAQRLLVARCACARPIRLSREVLEACAPTCSACGEAFALAGEEN